VVEVGGVTVAAVNLRSGNTVRAHFLRTYLNQDEEKYTAYWTVRRYIGKGTPPRTGQRCGGGEFRPDHAGGDRLCGRRRSETGTEYTAAQIGAACNHDGKGGALGPADNIGSR
jgi:hypothetical protein